MARFLQETVVNTETRFICAMLLLSSLFSVGMQRRCCGPGRTVPIQFGIALSFVPCCAFLEIRFFYFFASNDDLFATQEGNLYAHTRQTSKVRCFQGKRNFAYLEPFHSRRSRYASNRTLCLDRSVFTGGLVNHAINFARVRGKHAVRPVLCSSGLWVYFAQ